MDPYGYLLILALLAAGTILVFRRVRADYRSLGRLSRGVSIAQTGFFCVYALCSYVFLDSRIAHIAIRGALLVIALLLMAAGFAMVAAAMSSLGSRSTFAGDTPALRTAGLYRYSRNPQLVGGFLFIIGYAMLWPSWHGALWALLFAFIGHVMVLGEEEHLHRLFGEPYRAYCRQTPRYLGLTLQS